MLYERCNRNRKVVQTFTKNWEQHNSLRLVKYIELPRKASGCSSTGEVVQKREILAETQLCAVVDDTAGIFFGWLEQWRMTALTTKVCRSRIDPGKCSV